MFMDRGRIIRCRKAAIEVVVKNEKRRGSLRLHEVCILVCAPAFSEIKWDVVVDLPDSFDG